MAIQWFKELILGKSFKTMSIGEAIAQVHEDQLKIDNQRKNINGLAKKYIAAKKRIVELEDQVKEYKNLSTAWKTAAVTATVAYTASETLRTNDVPNFDKAASVAWNGLVAPTGSGDT